MKFELSYAAIFTSAVILTGAVLWSLAQQPQTLLVAEEIVTSCRQISDSLLSSRFHLQTILSFLLLGLGLKAAISIWKTYLKLAQLQRFQVTQTPATIKKLCQQHQISSNQIVIIKDQQKKAMTLGLRRPKIILSTGLIQALSYKQLEAVLLHELYHLKHAHPALFIWGELVSSTLFFLPSLADIFDQMKFQLESQADQFAVTSQKTSRFLKQAVIKNLKIAEPVPSMVPSFAASVLEQRIAVLSNTSQPQSLNLKKMAITLVVIAASLVFLHKPTTIKAETYQTQNQSKCDFLQCVSSCVQEELMSKSRR